MAIRCLRGDITKLVVDCVVNAANERLAAGGGVCGAIHRLAGPQLRKECAKIGHCATGQAVLTGGYDLPEAKHVIHTVGPIWKDGKSGESALLESCYRETLHLAKTSNISSVAFPAISTGIYGFPKNLAAKIAVTTIRSLQEQEDKRISEVIFCCFDEETFIMYQDLLNLKH